MKIYGDSDIDRLFREIETLKNQERIYKPKFASKFDLSMCSFLLVAWLVAVSICARTMLDRIIAIEKQINTTTADATEDDSK